MDIIGFLNVTLGSSTIQLHDSLNGLNSEIDSVKVESSPGLDVIIYKVFKYLPEETRKVLLALYNEILQTGDFPSEQKQYAIFFILKADGTNF
jgi:hypothetical protein